MVVIEYHMKTEEHYMQFGHQRDTICSDIFECNMCLWAVFLTWTEAEKATYANSNGFLLLLLFIVLTF